MYAYLAWCAFWWWVRGGPFGVAYRKVLGIPRQENINITQLTRGFCSFFMVLPLVFVNPWLAIVWPFLWAAMCVGYLGEAMGQERQPRDLILMSFWGILVASIASLPSLALQFWPLCGILAGPIYAVNRRIGNDRWLFWTERSEMAYGATMGLVLWGVYVHIL